MKILRIFLFMLIGLNLAFSQSSLKDKEYDVGILAGYWLGGEVNVDDFGVDKDGSFMLKMYSDFYLMPKFAFGLFVHVLPYSQGLIDVNSYEFGVALKPRFFINETSAIKPGINLGYRLMTSDGFSESVSGFGVNFSLELQSKLESMILSPEIGFLTQPAGGNEDFDLAFAPILYFGLGISF